MDMKMKFSIRGANYTTANYTTAVFLPPEDRRQDVEWIIKVFFPLKVFLSPQPPAWVRVVELGGGRWDKIVVMPRSDRLYID